MIALVGVFVVTSGAAFALGARLGRGVLSLAAAPLAVTVVVLAAWWPRVARGAEPAASWVWVEQLGVRLSFQVTGFGWFLAAVVVVTGLIVASYSVGYFGGADPAVVARFAGWFVVFSGAMLGLVLASDLWTLFVFWEATSVASFFLIGLDDTSPTARAAALRALLVTGAGGLAMLAGFAVLAAATGTSSLAGVLSAPASGTGVGVGLALVLAAAFSKSAQVPLHFWLPGAMSAPTPVSAYLHSATMVKAGVVVVAWFAPAFSSIGWWQPVLVCVGGATMLWGGLLALREHDAKLILAYGTVSQLGLLVVTFGLGIPDVTAAAVGMLLAHAVFKASLFMVVGIVDHATGTRDLRQLGGLGRELPVLAVFAGVSAASMAGFAPSLGFVAKESVLASLLDAPGMWPRVALVCVAAGSALTVAYSIRWWTGVFGARRGAAVADAERVIDAPSWWSMVPVAVLSAVSVMGGLAASSLGVVLGPAAESLAPDAHGHWALWAGWTPALGLSVVVVVFGAALWWFSPTPGGASSLSAVRVYDTVFDSVLSGSRFVAGVTQRGSLPFYVLVVFVVVAAVPVVVLVTGWPAWDVGSLRVADSAVQAVVVALVSVLALAVAVARRRFAAVMLLGGVGYGLAVVFFLYGAPDLALTQVLIETLMVVVFMLVVRRLPARFTAGVSWSPRVVRVGVAVAVGAGMAALAVAAGAARTGAPVTEEMAARSVPEAGGRNLVNVIIVDFRGFDTMGEITVLAVAAIGVMNLVRVARRTSSGTAQDDRQTWSRLDRSVIFDTVARMVFHVTLVVSLYVMLRGHNAPGGGFAGGLIAGAAFLMRYLAHGQPPLRRSWRPAPAAVVGVGLGIAALTALAGLIGGDLLESAMATAQVPGIGPVKLVSSTAFDVGVYVVVVGAVLALVTALGETSSAAPALDESSESVR